MAVQVFVNEKIAPIYLTDFSSCRLKNDTGCGKILIRLVRNDGSFRATHGNIAYVSTGASQIADFTRECGSITAMKPGVGEKKAFVVNIFFIGYVYFSFSQKSFLSSLCIKKIAGCRHIKYTENRPEILDKGKRHAPDRNARLKIGNAI